jgi:hypothetical protein
MAHAAAKAHSAKSHPATKRRGADPHVPPKAGAHVPPHTVKLHERSPEERKLEQGLEESMAGSDPISITQPAPRRHEDHHDKGEGGEGEK